MMATAITSAIPIPSAPHTTHSGQYSVSQSRTDGLFLGLAPHDEAPAPQGVELTYGAPRDLGPLAAQLREQELGSGLARADGFADRASLRLAEWPPVHRTDELDQIHAPSLARAPPPHRAQNETIREIFGDRSRSAILGCVTELERPASGRPTPTDTPDPPWVEALRLQLDGFVERLTALEATLGRIVDAHAGVPGLREGIVSDISAAVGKWANPILEDNAVTKQALRDLASRVAIIEGKVEEMLKHKAGP